MQKRYQFNYIHFPAADNPARMQDIFEFAVVTSCFIICMLSAKGIVTRCTCGVSFNHGLVKQYSKSIPKVGIIIATFLFVKIQVKQQKSFYVVKISIFNML
jgi:hypothetical protein